MKKIKVLNLFTIMHRAGAETLVMNYYRNIDRNKFQFDFIVHRSEKGDYDDEIRSLGGNIYKMCPIYPQNFNKYKKMISKFFDEHSDYDIIHSHCSELGYFFFKEAKKRGVKVLISHAHSTPVGFDKKTLFREYFKIRMRPYITDYFVCSEDSGKWLFGKNKVGSFYHMKNAIDTNVFCFDNVVRSVIRNKLNINDKFVIGHIGRFTNEKNHRYIIDILEEINNNLNNVALVLIGDGELKNEIMNNVICRGLNDKVIFVSTVDNVEDYFSAMDIFILPSKFEGFGNVLLEAQSTGIKCLASKKVVPNIVKVTELLHFIPLNDKQSWVEEIINEIKVPTKRYSRSIEIKKAHYDIQSNVKKLEKYYENAFKR